MNAIRSLLLTLLACLSLAVSGRSWTPDELPDVTSRTTKVINPDNILADSVVSRMEAAINTLSPKGAEIYVVCVETIDPDDPYRFAIEAARGYHVGGKRNLGVLLLLATKSRAYQIVTGSAMEKYLTDADCDRIEQQYMLPWLKQEKWAEALVATVDQLVGVIANQEELKGVTDGEEDLYGSHDEGNFEPAQRLADQPSASESEEQESRWPYAIGAVLLTTGFVVWAKRDDMKKKKCPKCGKHHIQKTYKDLRLAGGITADYTGTECPDCGYAAEETVPKRGGLCPKCNEHHLQAVKILDDNHKQGSRQRYVVQMLCADCGYTEEKKQFKPEDAILMGGVAAEQIYATHKRWLDNDRDRDRDSSSSRSSSSYSARDRDGGSFSGGGAGGRF